MKATIACADIIFPSTLAQREDACIALCATAPSPQLGVPDVTDRYSDSSGLLQFQQTMKQHLSRAQI
jgi:hypothetical protein